MKPGSPSASEAHGFASETNKKESNRQKGVSIYQTSDAPLFYAACQIVPEAFPQQVKFFLINRNYAEIK